MNFSVNEGDHLNYDIGLLDLDQSSGDAEPSFSVEFNTDTSATFFVNEVDALDCEI